MRPEQCKIDAVREFQQPRTKKQVRAFLGLAGYYRKFIPDFATIAVPLTNLTKKSASAHVQWGKEQKCAFDQLKEMLTSSPVLNNPDFSRPFILQTDASDVGIGSVLSQMDEKGEEHPIAYASRKLLPRETRYAAVEKECLAIVEGVRTFRVYLEGRPFQIQTDHRSLQYLNRMRDHNGCLARWSLYLQPYQFSVRNADGLSREDSPDSVYQGKGEVSGGSPDLMT